MIVLIVERVSASVRGELTRWLLEPRTGVFVGTVSAEVRERLWDRACGKRGTGSALLVWRADTEQGFAMRLCGEARKQLRDFDGLILVNSPD